MQAQQGFTLIELMIVIAIIAILSAIGIPAYQRYLQKAAMTDMLQAMTPYKMAVELCALEQGDPKNCKAGANGIPQSASSRYVSNIDVSNGVITLTGQQTLQGLAVILTPTQDSTGLIRWSRNCKSENSSLSETCAEVFRFEKTSETPSKN